MASTRTRARRSPDTPHLRVSRQSVRGDSPRRSTTDESVPSSSSSQPTPYLSSEEEQQLIRTYREARERAGRISDPEERDHLLSQARIAAQWIYSGLRKS